MRRLLGALAVALSLTGTGAFVYGMNELGDEVSNRAGDIICRTDRMSSTTYRNCHWTDSDGVRRGTVETCFDHTDYCTIREQ